MLPLGHNGSHLVSIVKVTDNDPATDDDSETQIRFAKDTGALYESGPSALSANVQNLVITDVSTSNGTLDYFKWDPNTLNSNLDSPQISFNIKDALPKFYKWTVFFAPTAEIHSKDDDSWLATASQAVGYASSEGPVPVHLADFMNFTTHEPGTYAFDLRVDKYAENPNGNSAATLVDSFQFKRPYMSWIPHSFQDGNGVSTPGHSVKYVSDADMEKDDVRANYYLYPNPGSKLKSLQMTVIGPGLAEKSTTAGPTTTGVLHGGDEGYSLYSRNRDEGGDWRVVFTGIDSSGVEVRRDHQEQRMIPVNSVQNLAQSYQLAVARGFYKNTLHYLYFEKAGLIVHGGRTEAQQLGVTFERSIAQALDMQLTPNIPEINFNGSRPDLVSGILHVKDPSQALTDIFDLNPSDNDVFEIKLRSHFAEIKATDNTIGINYQNGQLRKQIDYLSRSSPVAYSEIRPMLTLIGLRYTQWGPDIAEYASTPRPPYDPDTYVSLVKVKGLRWYDKSHREVENAHNIEIGVPIAMPGTNTPPLVPGTFKLIPDVSWDQYGALGKTAAYLAYHPFGGSQGHFP